MAMLAMWLGMVQSAAGGVRQAASSVDDALEHSEMRNEVVMSERVLARSESFGRVRVVGPGARSATVCCTGLTARSDVSQVLLVQPCSATASHFAESWSPSVPVAQTWSGHSQSRQCSICAQRSSSIGDNPFIATWCLRLVVHAA